MHSPLAAHSGLSLRDARPDDANALSDLNARAWRAHYPGIITPSQVDYMLARFGSPDFFSALLTGGKRRIFMAEDATTLMGYAALEPRDNGVWYLDKLYVDVSAHGHGTGSTLLMHAIRTLQPTILTLRVNRRNIKAINFYFKHGFFITALDTLDIGEGYVMDDFLMQRKG